MPDQLQALTNFSSPNSGNKEESLPRASNILQDHIIKKDWPGTPELTISQVVIAKVGSTETMRQRVIVAAVAADRQYWTASEPVKIEGWVSSD